eukprot:IDg19353t1
MGYGYSIQEAQSSENRKHCVKYSEVPVLPVYKWRQTMNSVLRYYKASKYLYMVQELRNIHRRTGNPSTSRLMQILQRSPHISDLRPETRALLNKISDSCRARQIMGNPPERFRFSLHDDALFNHELVVYIFKLSEGK